MSASNSDLVYLNGEYKPKNEASVSILDRGFLLGDSIYEVIPVYFGKPFRLEEHLIRLENSLQAIRLKNPLSAEEWQQAIRKITRQFDVNHQSIYLQVTRGVSMTRDHIFPEDCVPTVLIMSTPVDQSKHLELKGGITAITVDDIRWKLCRVKATTLLANVLARQQAIEENAMEAILIRDGYALEGAATNLFIVKNSIITTPPKGDELLPGITRDLILELAQANNIKFEEKSISLDQLRSADEIWLSSSVRELVAVIELDKEIINNGEPGPLWQKMSSLFDSYKQNLRGL